MYVTNYRSVFFYKLHNLYKTKVLLLVRNVAMYSWTNALYYERNNKYSNTLSCCSLAVTINNIFNSNLLNWLDINYGIE